jgi:hypothetical protein
MAWSRRNFAPVLFLWIDGKDASDLLRITTSFSHKMSTAKAAETTFVMRNDKRKLLDDPRTFPNKIWKFRYGFFGDISKTVTGILRGVDPKYRDKRTVTFTLYDASLNLSQASSGKTWGMIPSSEVARRIAKAHGMEAVVDPSNDKPKRALVQPMNVNDMQYLRDLAADIDFEVFVEGSPQRLYYRKKPYEQKPHRVLTYYDDPTDKSYVIGFEPKVKSLGPLKTATAQANTGSGKDGKSASSKQGKGSALGGYVSMDGNSGKSSVVTPPKPPIDIGDASLALAAGSFGGVASPLISTTLLAAAPVSKLKEQMTKPIPGGANASSLAAAARSQQLDKANEASSDHPLTPSIIVGNTYVLAGIEKQVNGKWYCHEGSDEISGTGASSKRSWKRNMKGAGKEPAKNQNSKEAPKDEDKYKNKSFLGTNDFKDLAGAKKVVVVDGDSGENTIASSLGTVFK